MKNFRKTKLYRNKMALSGKSTQKTWELVAHTMDGLISKILNGEDGLCKVTAHNHTYGGKTFTHGEISITVTDEIKNHHLPLARYFTEVDFQSKGAEKIVASHLASLIRISANFGPGKCIFHELSKSEINILTNASKDQKAVKTIGDLNISYEPHTLSKTAKSTTTKTK